MARVVVERSLHRDMPVAKTCHTCGSEIEFVKRDRVFPPHPNPTYCVCPVCRAHLECKPWWPPGRGS